MNMIVRWFRLHRDNGSDALRRLFAQPVATGLTVTVIAIAIAMPAALQMVVASGQSLAGNLDDIRDFSVYLKPGTELPDAQGVATRLKEDVIVSEVTLITADEALERMRQSTGMDELVSSLGDNPLPHTLVVSPEAGVVAAELEAFRQRIEGLEDVDQVRIDTEWAARLNALLALLDRVVWIAAIMLVTAVVIITGNTIRLDIQNRRDEIEVCKLLGASDGFVRRPFLYTGAWYGVLGSVLAVVILVVGGLLLAGPLEELMGLYEGSFTLSGLSSDLLLAVLLGGIVAGWGGAWTAVARHLSAIQPE